jgi:hypothetical protein
MYVVQILYKLLPSVSNYYFINYIAYIMLKMKIEIELVITVSIECLIFPIMYIC